MGTPIFNSIESRVEHRKAAGERFKEIIERHNNLEGIVGFKTDYTLNQYLYDQLVSKDAVCDFATPPTPTIASKIRTPGTKEKEMYDEVTQQAGLGVIQMFYDLYMSDKMPGDIVYRLGEVTEELPEFSYDLDKKTMRTVQTAQTTTDGRIYASSNFFQTWKVKGYNSNDPKGGTTEYEEHYANLFFPPFMVKNIKTDSETLKQAILTLKTKRTSYVDPVTNKTTFKTEVREEEVQNTMWDESTTLNFRGKFTYRKTGFKVVNDNINLIQYLFEKVSGIVCTYLTEWDLSQYFQECLISDTGQTRPTFIGLTNRIGDDGITTGRSVNESLGFGVINAAISKLYGANNVDWHPGEYPLSTYWTQYPDWTHSTNKDLRRFWSNNKYAVWYPAYLDFITETDPTTIMGKIQQDDFEGQAFSGFWKWDLQFWKALYTTAEDKLSDLDVELMNFTLGEVTKAQVLNAVRETSFGIDLEEAGTNYSSWDNSFEDVNWDPDHKPLVSVSNSEAERNRLLAAGKENPAPPIASVEDIEKKHTSSLADFGSKVGNSFLNMASTIMAPVEDAIKVVKTTTEDTIDSWEKAGEKWAAQAKEINETTANAWNGMFGITGSSDKNKEKTDVLQISSDQKDNACGIGINQRANTLYGGPHGMYHSPYSVQSFMEENNPFLRNCARFNTETKPEKTPWDLVENRDSDGYAGNEKWSTSSCNSKEDVGHPRVFEQSYTTGLKLLENGITQYTTGTAIFIDYDTYFTMGERIKGYGGWWWSWWFRYHYTPYELRSRFPGVTGWWNEKTFRRPYSDVSWSSGRYGKRWDYWGDRYLAWENGTPMSNGLYEYQTNDESWIYWRWVRVPMWQWWDWYYQDSFSYSHGQYCGCYVRKRYAWSWDLGWYCEILAPFRYVTQKTRRYKTYKKYIQHSMPKEHWAINKIEQGDISVSSNWGSGWWGSVCQWWGRLFGCRTTYTCSVRNIREIYKLWFPDSRNTRSKALCNAKDPSKSGTFYHTTAEDECIRNIVDMKNTGWGQPVDLFFLQGNTSLADRNANGPKNIFQCACRHKDMQFVWYSTVIRTKNCSYDWWVEYIPHWDWDDYIEVDLLHPKTFWTDCNLSNDSVPSNQHCSAENVIKESTIAEGLQGWNGSTKLKEPAALITGGNPTVSYPLGDSFKTGSVGMQGWGLMSMWQGLLMPGVEASPYGDNADMKLDSGSKDVPFTEVPFSYYDMYLNTGNYLAKNYGSCYLTGGVQRFNTYELDDALKRCWLNACLRCTIYRSEDMQLGLAPDGASSYAGSLLSENYWHVPMDVGFRLFYAQACYQVSYLRQIKELFCGTLGEGPNAPKAFDFVKMGNKIRGVRAGDGIVSEKVLSLARNNQKDRFGYNRWIKEALEWFPTANATRPIRVITTDKKGVQTRTWINGESQKQAEKKAIQKQLDLGTAFDTRISALDTVIEVLGPLVAKEIKSWTYNDIGVAKAAINRALAECKAETIENFFMAYLNCLYEYRRYFINKRCNKQDGTLWQLRHLESAVPMAVSKVYDNANPGAGAAIGDINVAFYEINNTTEDKIQAGKENKQLEDRVMVCYVPVAYTTEEVYKADLDFVATENNKLDENGKRIGDTDARLDAAVVKVKKYVYLRNDEGELILDREGNAIPDTSNIKIKYAFKPEDGLYRLVSKDVKRYITNKTFNNLNGDPTKAKFIDPIIEGDKNAAPAWVIDWGLPSAESQIEQGTTDILFDVYDSIDVARTSDLIETGITSPLELMCGSKKANDYWKVIVPEDKMPLAAPYTEDVQLVKVPKDNENGTQTPDPVEGVFYQTLYPIVKDQPLLNTVLGIEEKTVKI